MKIELEIKGETADIERLLKLFQQQGVVINVPPRASWWQRCRAWMLRLRQPKPPVAVRKVGRLREPIQVSWAFGFIELEGVTYMVHKKQCDQIPWPPHHDTLLSFVPYESLVDGERKWRAGDVRCQVP